MKKTKSKICIVVIALVIIGMFGIVNEVRASASSASSTTSHSHSHSGGHVDEPTESSSTGASASSASGTSTSSSTGTATLDPDEIINQGQSFVGASPAITTSEAISTLLPIGKILVIIASGVLVVVGLVLGVKYMISGANEKANLKEKLIWYIIAIVLVYGAVAIATLVANIANSIAG